jgi:tetratricopeptide (TPR) repeat protein
MIARDGRVLVTDFGLARHVGATPTSPEHEGQRQPTEASDARITREGAIVGTPAYMAPEQYAVGGGDARSDQFGFCVAAWEALYGQRPYPGDSLPELIASVLDARIADPPSGRAVPAWLRRVLERGLRYASAERWASMHELLLRLERGAVRRRARLRLLTLGLCVGVAGIAWTAHRMHRDALAEECRERGSEIADDWSPADRAWLHDAFAKTGTRMAATTADRVAPWLDAWTARWQQIRAKSCRAHALEGRDDDLAARSEQCLVDRRGALQSAIASFGAADAATVHRAVRLVAALPPVEPCDDAVYLSSRPLPPQALLHETMSLRTDAMRATGMASSGDHEQAVAVAEDALQRAETLGWPPLTAEIRTVLASVLEDAGDYEAAQQELEQAYTIAGLAQAPETAATAAIEAIFIVGSRRGRIDEALVWARTAEVTIAALEPDADGPLTADRLNVESVVLRKAGRHAEGDAAGRRALEIRERTLGAEHPAVATSLNNLANGAVERADFAAARELHERALGIRERMLGPDHPEVAMSATNLSAIALRQGRLDDAQALSRRALTIQESVLGPDHIDLAPALANFGNVLLTRREYALALPLFERVLAAQEKALGPEHRDIAAALNSLATAYGGVGRFADEIVLKERAVAISERQAGSPTPQLASLLTGLGAAYGRAGRLDEAIATFERGLAIVRATDSAPGVTGILLNGLGLLHVRRGDLDKAERLLEESLPLLEGRSADLPPAHTNLARLRRAQGRWDEALALLDRSEALWDAIQAGPSARAESMLVEALVRDDQGDRAAAVALAETALAAVRDAGDHVEIQREIEATLERWRPRAHQ